MEGSISTTGNERQYSRERDSAQVGRRKDHHSAWGKACEVHSLELRPLEGGRYYVGEEEADQLSAFLIIGIRLMVFVSFSVQQNLSALHFVITTISLASKTTGSDSQYNRLCLDGGYIVTCETEELNSYQHKSDPE
jgi:hypothetical protein